MSDQADQATQPRKKRKFHAVAVVRKHANSKPIDLIFNGNLDQPQHAKAHIVFLHVVELIHSHLKDKHELVSLELEIEEPS